MTASDDDRGDSTRANKRHAQRACDVCRRRKSVFELVHYWGCCTEDQASEM
jgi:hypothetical protein